MKINLIKEVLRVNIKGQRRTKVQPQPLLIYGPPGTGKSSLVKQIAEECECELYMISMPSMSTEELGGIPDFHKDSSLDKYSASKEKDVMVTKWSVPNLIKTCNKLAEENPNGCILCLDDLHRTNLATSPYLYQLLEERRLGDFYLASNVYLVATANDSEEAGAVGMDSPLLDRVSMLKIDFDFETWYKDYGRFMNYWISSFIKTHPQYIQEEESTVIGEAYLTPRSATYFGNELEEYENNFIVENARDLALMKMSKTAANAFAKHVEYVNKINFEGMVTRKTIIDMGTLKPVDAILHAYIVNYIIGEKDAKYLVELIKRNVKEHSFIGFLIGELFNKYLLREQGKTVTEGVSILIDALITPTNKIGLTEELKKELLAVSGEFLV